VRRCELIARVIRFDSRRQVSVSRRRSHAPCQLRARQLLLTRSHTRWRNQGTARQRPGAVASPGFCNRGEVRYGSIGGLEYEVPQSRLYCLRINVALCSTALQCLCRVIRRSSMTMKTHTYYIFFGRPPMGGSFPLQPWRRQWPGVPLEP